MCAVPNITLNNGIDIPQLGFGVFLVKPEETVESVTTALEIGYLIKLVISNARPADLSAGGYIDSVIISPKDIIILGWGFLQSENDRVVIDTNLLVKRSALNSYTRPDVASAMGDSRLANAGIMVKLELNESLPLPDRMKLCIWTDDPKFGRHLLATPSQPWLCPADSQ